MNERDSKHNEPSIEQICACLHPIYCVYIYTHKSIRSVVSFVCVDREGIRKANQPLSERCVLGEVEARGSPQDGSIKHDQQVSPLYLANNNNKKINKKERKEGRKTFLSL